MKTDRWFYSAAGTGFLVMMLVGFRAFVTSGSGDGGRVIDPAIFRLDFIHGLAIAAWYVLFFIQSLLIAGRNHRLHFKLGWSAVAIGLAMHPHGVDGEIEVWFRVHASERHPSNFSVYIGPAARTHEKAAESAMGRVRA